MDGYNIIFAWDELNALSKESLDAARHRLMDILCNYQGFKKCVLILVFDAYRVPGSPGSIEQYHNIHVVYTKEAETADMFIERVTHEIGKNRRVRVATSDGMEQVIILGHGALRVSARMFHEEVQDVEKEIRRCIQGGVSMAPEITAEFVWSHIPKRPMESNKGSFGAVLAVAGSACYRGAAALTVEGALRTGAGIVTLASVEPVLAAVSARLPECCLCPCEPGAEGGISPKASPHPPAEGHRPAHRAGTGLSCPEHGPRRRDADAGEEAAHRLFGQCGAGCRWPQRRRRPHERG